MKGQRPRRRERTEVWGRQSLRPTGRQILSAFAVALGRPQNAPVSLATFCPRQYELARGAQREGA